MRVAGAMLVAVAVLPPSFVLAQKETPPDGPAKSKRQKSYKDPTGLVRQLRADLDNVLDDRATEDYSTTLATLIVVKKQFGYEVRSKNPLRIISVENGTAMFKQRSLPAAVVTAEMMMINRPEAAYDSVKLYYAAVSDAEFGVWRSVVTCWGDEKDKELDDWKKTVQFRPTR
jgi:hypothetical protein